MANRGRMDCAEGHVLRAGSPSLQQTLWLRSTWIPPQPRRQALTRVSLAQGLVLPHTPLPSPPAAAPASTDDSLQVPRLQVRPRVDTSGSKPTTHSHTPAGPLIYSPSEGLIDGGGNTLRRCGGWWWAERATLPTGGSIPWSLIAQEAAVALLARARHKTLSLPVPYPLPRKVLSASCFPSRLSPSLSCSAAPFAVDKSCVIPSVRCSRPVPPLILILPQLPRVLKSQFRKDGELKARRWTSPKGEHEMLTRSS